MTFYIDESGSINNHLSHNKYFVIALVRVLNKKSLKRSYKRFVSSNYDRLLELDKDKYHPKTGKLIKEGGKMFSNETFKELKGSQFDKEMKKSFVDFFSRKPSFELYIIKIKNSELTLQIEEERTKYTSQQFKSNILLFDRTIFIRDISQKKIVHFNLMSEMKKLNQDFFSKIILILNYP